jgi:hypothetical protein
MDSMPGPQAPRETAPHEQTKSVWQNKNGSWTVEYLLGNSIRLTNKEDAFLLDRISKQIHRDNSKPSQETLRSGLEALARNGFSENSESPLYRSLSGRLREAEMTRRVYLSRGDKIFCTLTVTGVNETQPDGSVRVSLESPSFQYDPLTIRLFEKSEQEIYNRLCQRVTYGKVQEYDWRVSGQV